MVNSCIYQSCVKKQSNVKLASNPVNCNANEVRLHQICTSLGYEEEHEHQQAATQYEEIIALTSPSPTSSNANKPRKRGSDERQHRRKRVKTTSASGAAEYQRAELDEARVDRESHHQDLPSAELDGPGALNLWGQPQLISLEDRVVEGAHSQTIRRPQSTGIENGKFKDDPIKCLADIGR